MPLPISNNLEYARANGEFMSEPTVPMEQWAEAIGFEPTYEDEHAARVRQAVEAASALADSRFEARPVERTEYESTAEREQYVAYAAEVSRLVRLMRDYSKSDYDLAA